MTDWVRDHVDPKWMRLTGTKKTLKKRVQELRERIGQTDIQQKHQAKLNYNAAIAKAKSKLNPMDWYKTWELARIDAELHKIPDIEGTLAITSFLNAIEAWLPTWADDYHKQLNEAAFDGKQFTRTLESIGKLFLQEVQRKFSGSRYRGGGSAFATMDDSDSDHNDNKTKNSNSRKKSHKDCPCGGGKNPLHRWDPLNCAAVQKAVRGAPIAKVKNSPSERFVTEAKKNIKKSKYKELVKRIKELPEAVSDDDSDAPEPRNQGGKKDNKKSKGKKEEESDDEIWNNKPINAMILPPDADEDDQAGHESDSESSVISEFPSSFAARTKRHKLYQSWILDNCSGFHIVNNMDHIVPGSFKKASYDDAVLVGDSAVAIKGTGKVVLEGFLDGPKGQGTRNLTLENVQYIPNFHTNVISAGKLRKHGLWINGQDNTLRGGLNPHKPSPVLRVLREMDNLLVAIYKSDSSSRYMLFQPHECAFPVFRPPPKGSHQKRKKRVKMRTRQSQQRLPRFDSISLWHLRSGHAGALSLEHLVQTAKGVRIKGLKTVHCDHCGQGKGHQVVSRRERSLRSRQPFWRIHLDIFTYPMNALGHRYALIIKAEYTGYTYSWPMERKENAVEILTD